MAGTAARRTDGSSTLEGRAQSLQMRSGCAELEVRIAGEAARRAERAESARRARAAQAAARQAFQDSAADTQAWQASTTHAACRMHGGASVSAPCRSSCCELPATPLELALTAMI